MAFWTKECKFDRVNNEMPRYFEEEGTMLHIVQAEHTVLQEGSTTTLRLCGSFVALTLYILFFEVYAFRHYISSTSLTVS
jgi:hypothetical protein